MVARFQTTRRPFILFLPAGDVMKKTSAVGFSFVYFVEASDVQEGCKVCLFHCRA